MKPILLNPYSTESLKIGFFLDLVPERFSDDHLRKIFFDLTKDRASEAMLYESASLSEMDDAYNCGERLTDSELRIFESVYDRYNRLDYRLSQLIEQMNMKFSGDLKALPLTSDSISKPKKRGGFATITAKIDLSDGQTITALFHADEAGSKKVAPSDQVISYAWFLNKRDITAWLEKSEDSESGVARDIVASVASTAVKLVQLAEKNSESFKKRSGVSAENKKKIAELKQELESELRRAAEIAAEFAAQHETLVSVNSEIERLRLLLDDLRSGNDMIRKEIDRLKGMQSSKKGKPPAEPVKTPEAVKTESESEQVSDMMRSLEEELKGRGFQGEDGEFTIDGQDKKKKALRSIRIAIRQEGIDKIVIDCSYRDEKSEILNNSSFVAKTHKGLSGIIKKALRFADSYMRLISITEPATTVAEPEPVVKPNEAEAMKTEPVTATPAEPVTPTEPVAEPEQKPAEPVIPAEAPPEPVKEEPKEQAMKAEAPEAVTTLNDIIAGKYDDDDSVIDVLLDKAADELDKAGLSEQYDALLNQAADHLTALYAKQAQTLAA